MEHSALLGCQYCASRGNVDDYKTLLELSALGGLLSAVGLMGVALVAINNLRRRHQRGRRPRLQAGLAWGAVLLLALGPTTGAYLALGRDGIGPAPRGGSVVEMVHFKWDWPKIQRAANGEDVSPFWSTGPNEEYDELLANRSNAHWALWGSYGLIGGSYVLAAAMVIGRQRLSGPPGRRRPARLTGPETSTS